MDYEKLNQRIEHMFSYETDNFFVNIQLDKFIENKLYDFQVFHLFNLITAFRNNNVVLDGSDTGTGKTYTTIALCKQLKLKPFIICPKTLISYWKQVCSIFNVVPIAIVNYEAIKSGKWNDKNGNLIKCDLIEPVYIPESCKSNRTKKIRENIIDNSENNKNQIEKKIINGYTWNLPRYSIVVFDEVHRCRNKTTINGQLLLSTKNLRNVLLLSATLTDKPEHFHIFGYMLGCYNNMRKASNWINGMILQDKTSISKEELSAINKYVYPNKGSRMRIKELGDKFPSNQISAHAYYIENNKREIINKAFLKIYENSVNTMNTIKKSSESSEHFLIEIMKARQVLEKIKVPIIAELAKDYTSEGYNVAIFVNFNDSITELSNLLKTKCIINGEVTNEARIENVNNFQKNKCNIIICNIAILEGIGLHDLYGIPRISLISPSFSASQLVQTLGRIYRAGAKTPALQRLIYCANTLEEVICNRIKEKLNFLSKLNDNDLIEIK